MSNSVSRTVDQKAERLLVEGRVQPYPGPVQWFSVRGANGTYDVVVMPGKHLCTCEHGRRAQAGAVAGTCAHVVAATRWVLAQGARQRGEASRADEYEAVLRAEAEKAMEVL